MTFEFNDHLFFFTFGLIFIAELPDKTALATLVMATRRHPVAVFLGVAGAFAVQSAVAVALGQVLSFLPDYVIKLGSAALFFGFSIYLWLSAHRNGDAPSDGTETRHSFWSTAASSFLVIFVAEWGDLTQLATATLEAKYQSPWTIFSAATLALWSVTAVTCLIGNKIKGVLKGAALHKIAALLFFVFGVAMLLQLR